MAFTDPFAARDDDLRTWRAQFPKATPIEGITLRTPVTCVGVVGIIRLVPGQRTEAVLTDGTGRLRAVWTGRIRRSGVELGAAVRVTGTPATGDDGMPVMRNPDWVPVAEPYQ